MIAPDGCTAQEAYAVLTRGAWLHALAPECFQGGCEGDAVCDLAHALPELVAAVQQLVVQLLNLQGNWVPLNDYPACNKLRTVWSSKQAAHPPAGKTHTSLLPEPLLADAVNICGTDARPDSCLRCTGCA